MTHETQELYEDHFHPAIVSNRLLRSATSF